MKYFILTILLFSNLIFAQSKSQDAFAKKQSDVDALQNLEQTEKQTEKQTKQNLEQVAKKNIKKLQQAADQGDTLALFKLAKIYFLELDGVSNNFVMLGFFLKQDSKYTSSIWLQDQANEGHLKATYLMIYAHFYGLGDVPQDYKKALFYLKGFVTLTHVLNDEQLYTAVILQIAKMYYLGLGTEKDIIESVKYLNNIKHKNTDLTGLYDLVKKHNAKDSQDLKKIKPLIKKMFDIYFVDIVSPEAGLKKQKHDFDLSVFQLVKNSEDKLIDKGLIKTELTVKSNMIYKKCAALF